MVTGGRDYTDYEKIKYTLASICEKGDTIVHGGCRCCDALCGKAAKELGLKVEVHKANWEKYGKGAGVIRNMEMSNTCDRLIAFPGGRGTKNAIKCAKECGIPVLQVV